MPRNKWQTRLTLKSNAVNAAIADNAGNGAGDRG